MPHNDDNQGPPPPEARAPIDWAAFAIQYNMGEIQPFVAVNANIPQGYAILPDDGRVVVPPLRVEPVVEFDGAGEDINIHDPGSLVHQYIIIRPLISNGYRTHGAIGIVRDVDTDLDDDDELILTSVCIDILTECATWDLARVEPAPILRQWYTPMELLLLSPEEHAEDRIYLHRMLGGDPTKARFKAKDWPPKKPRKQRYEGTKKEYI